jgi:hypothetical protein
MNTKLALGTHGLDLGAVALLGSYFWVLESILCLRVRTSTLSQFKQPGTSGVGKVLCLRGDMKQRVKQTRDFHPSSHLLFTPL